IETITQIGIKKILIKKLKTPEEIREFCFKHRILSIKYLFLHIHLYNIHSTKIKPPYKLQYVHKNKQGFCRHTHRQLCVRLARICFLLHILTDTLLFHENMVVPKFR